MDSEITAATDIADPRRFARLGYRLHMLAGKTEGSFLSILRYSALVIAAVVLVTAAVLLALGLLRQIGPGEVQPESVTVGPDDLQPGDKSRATATQPATVQSKSAISGSVRNRTLAIYQAKFKAFQRPDTKITDQQVVDLIWSRERIAQFNDLDAAKLLGREDKPLITAEAVMLDALAAIEETAGKGTLRKELAAYRDAKKTTVCTDEVRYQSRVVASWDSNATYCAFWFESPIGCASTRTIREPVIEKVCAMKFPADQDAPAQLFASAVERYGRLAISKRDTARIQAENAMAREQAKKLEGRANISLSGQLFFAFLAIMFLYLFIAMERHNRQLRALIAERGTART